MGGVYKEPGFCGRGESFFGLRQYRLFGYYKERNMAVADAKTADLAKDTVDANTKCPMTTDYGIKISNPDNWLRVGSEKQTGPSLLEDQIAREKVGLRSMQADGCIVE